MARAAEEANSATVSDPRCREAWAGPEFQSACRTALATSAAEARAQSDLSTKYVRFLETIKPRLGLGKQMGEVFTVPEIQAIAAECGLTAEELDQLLREQDLMLN